MTSEYLTMKRALAMQYLKEREIYILYGVFKPTNTANTDVAATIRRYRGINQPTLILRRKP